MTTINTAAAEYATRPPDERFPSLAALVHHATHEKNLSAERNYNAKDLRAVAQGREVMLASPNGHARMTHWAFGQVSRMIGAPAAYLRGLSPELAAQCVTYGLHHTATGTSATLLARAPNGKPEPVIRACTSETYGRVWDADLYGAVADSLTGHDDRWQLPPTWSGEPAGAYRGDRDSFLILTNGGSIVSDPSLRNASGGPADGNGMYRGILIRNSEVGASSVVIEQILYRYICGNHMLWGAVVDKSFKRRHVGKGALRDVVREVGKVAYAHVHASAARDQALIQALLDHELAITKDAVIDELRAMGASIEQATMAYDRCEQTEAASPRSFWGVAQGLTRISQETPYQDARLELDRLASVVLAKGARKVAA
jgi:hypothetical protein